MKKIVIVGGGAAGLMAAVSAARYGGQVTIIEKMPTVGRKLLITGKGRCNITNNCELEDFIRRMPGNGAFLHSALRAFSNHDIREFLQEFGVATKVERGGRVFPVSDSAKDVVNAFVKALTKSEVQVINGQAVKEIVTDNKRVQAVKTKDNTIFPADAVILAAGGASYPGTGSSGDGYIIAQRLGHQITPLKPSLVPIEVEEEWITDIMGLSLKNVTAAVFCQGKKINEEFGEMLFTHFGLSGPIILSLSKTVAELLNKDNSDLSIEINLKPALDYHTLDKRIQRDFEKFSRKQLKNALDELLPKRIIPIIIDLAYLDAEKFVHQITKEERTRLVNVIQHLVFTVKKLRPIAEAIVTAGGVCVKEINPKTMESKIITGLYFAGEVIDIDGYTGGYNLQAAFSTGFVAGKYAALK